jgi:hypothetical protein
MLAHMIRALLGFVAAAIAGGCTLALFVTTPRELAILPAAALGDALASTGWLALAAATSIALFGAPFALLAAALGEARGFRGAAFYAAIGVIAAGLAFLTLYVGEPGTAPGPASAYALAAFAATGLIAGLAYWLVAGRLAGSAERRATRLARQASSSRPAGRPETDNARPP